MPFEAEHDESVLEEWLESNPDGILEDGRILIVGRQVRTAAAGVPVTLGWDALMASDVQGRARAFQSMVGGGMDVARAAGLSGLLSED